MCSSVFIFILFQFFPNLLVTGALPPLFAENVCRNGSNFNECGLASMNRVYATLTEGIPEYGIQQTDPHIINMEGNNFGLAKVAGLWLYYRNMNITGARNIKFDSLHANLNTLSGTLTGFVDHIHASLDLQNILYLIGLPFLNQEGTLTGDFKNIKIKVDASLDIVNTLGDQYFQLKTYKIKLHFRGGHIAIKSPYLTHKVVTLVFNLQDSLILQIIHPLFDQIVTKLHRELVEHNLMLAPASVWLPN